MLNLNLSTNFKSEKEYVISFLKRYLDNHLIVTWEDNPVMKTYSIGNDLTRVYKIEEIFFKKLTKKYRSIKNIPNYTLSFKHDGEVFIFPYWRDEKLNSLEDILKLDFFGIIFYHLTLYEEWVNSETDLHERKLTNRTYIHQPIVDNLIFLIKHFFSSEEKRCLKSANSYSLILSCDIDRAYEDYSKNIFLLLRRLVGDFFIRKNFKEGLRKLKNYLFSNILNNYQYDAYNTYKVFNSKSLGLKNQIEFYLLAGDPSSSQFDQEYSLNKKRMAPIVNYLLNTEEKIGLHGSYRSFDNKDLLSQELLNLRKILGRDISLIRQHYLRWSHLTPSLQSNIGLKLDSTIGFTESIGFRSGTSMKYYLFCLEKKESLKIEEQPLIMMDHAILGLLRKYQSKEILFKILDDYYSHIKRVGGTLTILWHNSELSTFEKKNLLKDLITRYRC